MIHKVLLYAHIVTGFIGLFSGVITMSLKKGDQRHKKLGKVFYFSMLSAAVFAILLSSMNTNYFLFMIGIFTAYMVLNGRRYLSIRNEGEVQWFDKTLSIIMLIFSLGLIALGLQNIIAENYGGIVFAFFGFLSLMMTRQDYRNFTGKSKFLNNGLLMHIQRMSGAFIASLTAFMVVNINFLPDILVWLLPTFIVTPLISRWVRQNAKLKKSNS